MNLFLRRHPYWSFMSPWVSHREGRFGSEYHEFFAALDPSDYMIHPIALMEGGPILKMFLDQLGLDGQQLQYKLEHDILIAFRERKLLTAFILKFREGCSTWRQD